jgi:glycosyltransferase involved in cell wall biosynthesis
MVGLENQGCTVYQGWERKPENGDYWEHYTDKEKEIMLRPFEEKEFGVLNWPPYTGSYAFNQSRHKIVLTMTEGTALAPDWVKEINLFETVFVPTAWLIDVFKNSGVTRPIYVVPQGVNQLRYPYFNRQEHPTFRFGHISYLDDRKNYLAMVQAFVSAFPKGDEPVEMILKSSNPKLSTRPVDPRIKVISNNLTVEEMYELIKSFDCFVFPSRAEGSGLPPREAMSTGCPCIVTDFSGLHEISQPDINYCLTHFTIDVPDPRGLPGFQARIDVRELVYYMKYAFEHRDENKERGIKASKFIQDNYSWDKCAQNMIDIIQSL